MSIDDITRELVKDMEQNEAMQQDGEAKPIAVGGIQGRSVNLHSISPFPAANGQQQRERDWLVTVPQRDGTVIFMVFVAPQPQFDHFRSTYEAMLRAVLVSICVGLPSVPLSLYPSADVETGAWVNFPTWTFRSPCERRGNNQGTLAVPRYSFCCLFATLRSS